MAARPLDKSCTAKIISTCQTNILLLASNMSSFHSLRGILNGTFIFSSTKPSKGQPIHIERLRNVMAG